MCTVPPISAQTQSKIILAKDKLKKKAAKKTNLVVYTEREDQARGIGASPLAHSQFHCFSFSRVRAFSHTLTNADYRVHTFLCVTNPTVVVGLKSDRRIYLT